MLFRPRFDVVTIGSATRDFMFYDHQGTLLPHTTSVAPGLCFPYGTKVDIGQAHFTFGGGAANAAVNTAYQGWRTAVLTAIGADETAGAIVKNFQQRGVGVALVQQYARSQSSFAFIITAGDQREHVIFLYRGASPLLALSAAAARRIKTRWWYVTSLVGSSWRSILETAMHQPGMKAWNPGSVQLRAGVKKLSPFLVQTDILFLNRAEAITLLRTTAAVPMRTLLKQLHHHGPRVVVITNGKHGADAYDGTTFFHQAVATRRQPVDTTGVGDAHNSTFMVVFDATGGDCRVALRAAMRNATAVASKVGAQEGYIRVV